MSNNYDYQPFKLSDPPEQLGGWQYGVDDSKTQYDMQNGQKIKWYKSPAAYYMFALIAFMVFWFIYSLVFAIKSGMPTAMLLSYIPAFMVIVVCALIVVFSVFGLWGKFVRWALRKNAVSRRYGARARLEAEVDAADQNSGRENALNIYQEYIEVINYGSRRVLDRSLLREVTVTKYNNFACLSFSSMRGEFVMSLAEVPIADVHLIKKIFGDMCKVEKYAGGKKDKSGADSYVKEKFEWSTDKIGGFVMGLICTGAGCGVIALHYCVEPHIPSFLGMFFIVGGILAMMTVFSGVPIIKVFVIPFLFSIIFMGFPFMFVFSIGQTEEISFVWPTLHQFLCSFSFVSGGILFLAGMGFMIFLFSFYSLFKYLKYRD